MLSFPRKVVKLVNGGGFSISSSGVCVCSQWPLSFHMMNPSTKTNSHLMSPMEKGINSAPNLKLGPHKVGHTGGWLPEN